MSKPSLERKVDDLHKESAKRVEADTKHWECMTPEEASAALIKMQKDLDNQGLK
ncbi:MAG: hypothetical protein ACN6OP_17195 [Pseudomonadales bacterium]